MSPDDYRPGWLAFCHRNNLDPNQEPPRWAERIIPRPWEDCWLDDLWRNRWTNGLMPEELDRIPATHIGLSAFYQTDTGRTYGPVAQAIVLGFDVLGAANIDQGLFGRNFAQRLGEAVRYGVSQGFIFSDASLREGYRESGGL